MTATIRYVTEGFCLSGGHRIIADVCNALAHSGNAVEIVVPDHAAHPFFALDPRVEIVVVPTVGGRVLRKASLFAGVLAGAATRPADIYVGSNHRSVALLLGAAARSPKRSRVIYHVQHLEPLGAAYDLGRVSGRAKARLSRLGYQLPVEYVAVSSWLAEQTNAAGVTVISNGVDTVRFSPSASVASGEFTIGTIARPGRLKGYQVFLDALERLPREFLARIRAIVVAPEGIDSPPPPGVEMEVRTAAGEGAMVDFYRACGAFVFTSFSEGFGLPPLEAMACGTAVITTDCGGVRDYATASNSVIVGTGDASGIAAAIVQLATNPRRCRELGAQGRVAAEGFSRARMLDEYRAFFSRLLSDRAR